MQEEKEVLKLISDLPFPIGKNLMSELLRGIEGKRIVRLKLNKLPSFGCLGMYSESDIDELINRMLATGELKREKQAASGFLPVIVKGTTFKSPEISANVDLAGTEHLDKYNDEQKSAIISQARSILCVAGAGTGKTTVLTKRIENLVKNGVKDNTILAITFTRKARLEMKNRLADLLPKNRVNVETFNSFCEKQLLKNGKVFYDKEYRVMSFTDQINLVVQSLAETGYSMSQIIDEFYSKSNKEDKALEFVRDVFSMLDLYRNEGLGLDKFQDRIRSITEPKKRQLANIAYIVASKIELKKKEIGLRDYTDQLVHVNKLFMQKRELKPNFEHILVDEYQDVNTLQVILLKLLNPKNIFAVGDPRQSIFGWRGSKVSYIMDFDKDFPGSSTFQLTKNYRSHSEIVSAANTLISPMKLPNLQSTLSKSNKIRLIRHSDENCELSFLAHSITALPVARKNIFVLARTNRQLDKASVVLQENNINFLKRTVEKLKTDVSRIQVK